jgi:hypothetical protein
VGLIFGTTSVQGRKNYGAIAARRENKRLGAANELSLRATSFMKFCGPQALKDN